ncbi:hypothetical protein CEXT_342861 [Caerostris extrusa]|uniref:Uncharacterized protein n=1 Tax=Caerostris extrusa TaxID=172846 RepID=A0AAV4SC56_CAEEX|nr:hypothetical protein CEXT_342861 [Caerostris extrusa]
MQRNRKEGVKGMKWVTQKHSLVLWRGLSLTSPFSNVCFPFAIVAQILLFGLQLAFPRSSHSRWWNNKTQRFYSRNYGKQPVFCLPASSLV